MAKRLEHYFKLAGVPLTDLRALLPTNPGVPWRQREQRDVTEIVIHHTGTTYQATAAGIAMYHIGRGWPGIAYTFYIHTNGKVDFCHRIREWGPHAAPTNPYSLGICLCGLYTKVRPPKPMVDSLVGVINSLVLWYLDHNWEKPKVSPHYYWARTQCPGLVWDAYLEHPFCLDWRPVR